jgi:hypothetical protein
MIFAGQIDDSKCNRNELTGSIPIYLVRIGQHLFVPKKLIKICVQFKLK